MTARSCTDGGWCRRANNININIIDFPKTFSHHLRERVMVLDLGIRTIWRAMLMHFVANIQFHKVRFTYTNNEIFGKSGHDIELFGKCVKIVRGFSEVSRILNSQNQSGV